jgi:hypothetical protein
MEVRVQGFRESLRLDCQAAVLRAEGQDHWLVEMFNLDASVAHDWLIARIEAEPGSFPYHRFETVQSAIQGLSVDEELSVLDRLSLDPDSVDWQLLKELIGSDSRLFQILLGREHMRGFHLLPLGGPPTGAWCEMAVMALDAGYSPDDIANAAFPWIWSGDEAAQWNKYIHDFETLLGHEDPRLHAVSKVGVHLARERQQQAMADEHREKVFGLRG